MGTRGAVTDLIITKWNIIVTRINNIEVDTRSMDILRSLLKSLHIIIIDSIVVDPLIPLLHLP